MNEGANRAIKVGRAVRFLAFAVDIGQRRDSLIGDSRVCRLRGGDRQAIEMDVAKSDDELHSQRKER